MSNEIQMELLRCEVALYEMQAKYPALARVAAQNRIVYDVAWANAIDDIAHRATAEGQKPPTVSVQDAMATKMVADEMEAARLAEADLNAAKMHIETLSNILSSVQTRSKLLVAEMSLTR
jgi:hypothetical protein